jgi:hypothetical protein
VARAAADTGTARGSVGFKGAFQKPPGQRMSPPPPGCASRPQTYIRRWRGLVVASVVQQPVSPPGMPFEQLHERHMAVPSHDNNRQAPIEVPAP